MPIFEYECCDCKHKFEVLLSLAKKDSLPPCPECGKNNVKKLFSVFGFKSETRTSSSSCASCNATSCNGCSVR